MTFSLAAAGGWVVAATCMALLPRSAHWPGAMLLVVLGIPLAGWVTYENGPIWGMLAIAAGASVLRWPLVRLWQRLRRRWQGHAE